MTEQAHIYFTFGCQDCQKVPSSLDELAIKDIETLFDDEHLFYRVTKCSSCGQLFLCQFIEFIDWEGRWGGDQMWQRWAPVSAKEAAKLRQLTDAMLTAAAPALMVASPRLVCSPQTVFFWSDSKMDDCDLRLPG
jgi:hypothetical protein